MEDATLVIIETVEAIAIICLVLAVLYLWKEVKVPSE